MPGQTNLETNSQKELQIVQKFLDMAQSRWEGSQRTTKERLARKLQQYMARGGRAAVVVVPSKYVKELENALQNNNIGNSDFPDVQGGQSVFMIGAKDSERVQSILNLIYLNDPTRNKSIKASQVSKLADDLRVNVIALDLSGTEFENLDKISADKFYTNNMVGSTELDKDFVLEKQAYISGQRDLSTLLVDLSAYKYLEHADHENLMVRLAQAEYDEKVEMDFANAVIMKVPVTIAGKDKLYGNHIQYNGNDIRIHFTGKDNNPIHVTLDPSDYNNPKDLVIAIKKYTTKIHNMACYTPTELNDKTCVKMERPTKNSSVAYDFINEEFDKLITALAKEADMNVKYPSGATVETYIKMKTNYIRDALDTVEKNNYNESIPVNPLVAKYTQKKDTKSNVLEAQLQALKEDLIRNTVKNIETLKEHIKTETPAQVKNYAVKKNKGLEKTI